MAGVSPNAAAIAGRYGVNRPTGRYKDAPTFHIPEVCHGSTKSKDLRLWDGEGGSLGARCWSRGCSYQTILDALGVEFTYENRIHSTAPADDRPQRQVRRRRGPGKDLKGNYDSNADLLVKLSSDDVPDNKVALVEGEKAFDALAAFEFAGYTAAHWVGGEGSVDVADYSPLNGRDVILFPDAGTFGVAVMHRAAIGAQAAGARSLRMVDTSDLPEKADAADVDADLCFALLRDAVAFAPATALADIAPGALALGRGGQLQPNAAGFMTALSGLQLDLRGDSRSGIAEIRRRDHGSTEALGFTKQAGLRPSEDGWASLGTKSQDYLRDLFSDTYTYTNGKRYSVSQERLTLWMNALLASRMVDAVVTWLLTLPPWDGIERLPTLFIDAFAAEDTDLNRATAVAFMVGGVKRPMEPGCQHDWSPVLIGGQGFGKTTFCRLLMPRPRWYASTGSLNADTQKQAERIHEGWIVEFKEMRGAQSYIAVKNYLDDIADTYRRPYAQASEATPRRWFGIGTSNDEGLGVLPDDKSGNRRYVAIEVNTPGATREARSAYVASYLETNREQLWAEALHRYNAGEKSYLGGEHEAMQDDLNTKYTRSNQAMEEIAFTLTTAHANGGSVTLSDLMIEAKIAEDPAEAESKMNSAGSKLAGELKKFQWTSDRPMMGGVRRVVWYPPRAELADAVVGTKCTNCGTLILPDPEGLPRTLCDACKEDSWPASGAEQGPLDADLQVRIDAIDRELQEMRSEGVSYAEANTLTLKGENGLQAMGPADPQAYNLLRVKRNALQALRAAKPDNVVSSELLELWGGAAGVLAFIESHIDETPWVVWDSFDWIPILRDASALVQEQVKRERQVVRQQFQEQVQERVRQRLLQWPLPQVEGSPA